MIQTVFASKGFLVDVDLPLDPQAGKHAGFGYLKFSSVHATKAALEALQGTLIDGHSINLEISDSSPVTTPHTSLEPRGTFRQGKTDKSEDTSNVQARKSLNSHNPREPLGRLKAPRSTEQGNKGKERASDGNGKSLAFSEPNSSSSQASSKAGLGLSDSVNDSRKTTYGNGALLDQDNGDSEFSARYPSLLPDRSTRRPRFGNTPDPLIHLSPELEMRRFPPVSQLDAHAMANKRGDEQSTAMSSVRDTERDTDRGGAKDIEARRVTSPSVPGSFPQDPQNFPEMEEESKQNLRRSNTVMPVNPSARLARPFNPLFPVESDNAAKPLRRRATEHQSFQGKVREGRQPASQWERSINKTDQSIHPSRRSGYHHEPPANRHHMAHKQVSQTRPPVSIDNAEDGTGMGCQQIDDCVATLLRLGYGGVRDGGHARIRMYSEVANGKVLEAIEMIEEERKAYEQQMPQR
ncbi:hypothetical protein PHISP_05053 [Aspergillus sp. HF37]|nr:hypothetical protein PHISP_05053 [Aspergillus sp. HF37]